ncbi:hypothetical protein GCM10023216_21950 [Isoptericola chiayiensis]|uniref:Uncharacterized protein n=1 Tax=Isoptericola chiayiensis TaxID=579446 RepID=A0ABP8YI86_9MICO
MLPTIRPVGMMIAGLVTLILGCAGEAFVLVGPSPRPGLAETWNSGAGWIHAGADLLQTFGVVAIVAALSVQSVIALRAYQLSGTDDEDRS